MVGQSSGYPRDTMRTCVNIICGVLFTTSLVGAEVVPDGRDVDHAALRTLLKQATIALNERKVDVLATILHQPCSIVAVDQSRATSPVEVKALFDRWLSPEGGITSLTFNPSLDGPAVFLDEHTAYATGTSQDTYILTDGRTVVIPERWTATVVKGDAGWRLATLHCGVNLIDNPVLQAGRHTALRWTLVVGGIALALGLIVGLLVGRWVRRPH